MSPIFKSDTARAIAKEVGLGDLTLNKNAKSTKKRSLTISGSSPAVTEALNNHQAKVLFFRSNLKGQLISEANFLVLI